MRNVKNILIEQKYSMLSIIVYFNIQPFLIFVIRELYNLEIFLYQKFCSLRYFITIEVFYYRGF